MALPPSVVGEEGFSTPFSVEDLVNMLWEGGDKGWLSVPPTKAGSIINVGAAIFLEGHQCSAASANTPRSLSRSDISAVQLVLTLPGL